MTHPTVPRSLTALAVEESVRRCIDEGSWRSYAGPQLEQLTEWFQCEIGHPHVRFCSSGTLGVELALRSLHLRLDDEVLLCAYDYPGNFRAIEDCGARVVLCNPAPSRQWTIDVDCLERTVAPETKVLIVSHLHGELTPMERIVPWAHERGIAVIEDACQAIGATLHGRPVGSWGDLAVFSFGGSKLVSAGRGGAVVTSDSLLAQRMTRYCEKGNDAFAMSELQAAAIVPQCKRLKEDHEVRQRNAELLKLGLAGWSGLQGPAIHSAQSSPAYYKLGLRCDFRSWGRDRDQLLMKWNDRGIHIGVGFPGFANRSRKRYRSIESLEASQQLAASTLVLHHSHLLDPFTGASSIDRVLEAFEELEKERRA